MPKREDIEAQIAELQKQLESGDDEYEIEIEDVTAGKKVRLPRSAGTPWLKKHFPDLYEELLGEGEPEEEPPAKGGKQPAKDTTVTRFGRRVG